MNYKDMKSAADKITLSEEKKQEIIDECVKNIDNTDFAGERVSGVERVKSRPVLRFAAMAAACAVIVGGVGTTMHFMSRNGGSPSQFSEGLTDEAEAPTPFGDFTEMYYWFIGGRSENPDDRIVVGEYLNSVEWKSTELTDINTHTDDIPEYIIDINEEDQHKLIMIYADGVTACGELSADFDFNPEVVFTQQLFEDAPVTYYQIDYPGFDEQMLAFEKERGIRIKNINGTLVPPVDVEMPDVSNMEYKLAMDQLLQMPFERVEFKTIPSDEVKDGYVIRSDPEAGTTVSSDTTIILYVSRGPEGEAESVKVSDYVGMNVKDAVTDAEYYNLCPKLKYTGGDNEDAIITEQSIEAGSVVEPGTVIFFTIGAENRLGVDFALPDENVYISNPKYSQRTFTLSKEKRDLIVSAIELGCYEAVTQETVDEIWDNVSPEEQLGFHSYFLGWNDGNSWGELVVYDKGIVVYKREVSGNEDDPNFILAYYRIKAPSIDTKIRNIMGWCEGYCPFGTPYKTGLRYNGRELTGTQLREVSNAFFGYDWSKAEKVDVCRDETPTYVFGHEDTFINVYSDGTIEWGTPVRIVSGDRAEGDIYRLTDADGDEDGVQAGQINYLLEEALK